MVPDSGTIGGSGMRRHGANRLKWTLAALFLGALPLVAHAKPLQGQTSPVDGAIRGTVIDVATDRPVVAATVDVLDEAGRIRSRATTGGDGEFLLSRLSPGGFRLRVRALGYTEVVSPRWRVETGEVLTVVLRVHPEAILLAPLEVTARTRTDTPVLQRFYERMDRGVSGVFFDREEIEARNPIRITDLLAEVPGVRLVGAAGDGDPRRDQIIRFSRSLGQAGGVCPAQIFVDGMPANRGGQEVPLDVLASPGMLEGIEVYRGLSGVPPEFLSSDARCGVVALWTRRAGTRTSPDQ
ncbi:MAG: TonB-dependent receptor [Gemmatimonadales bacterium]|nr:MAG: TonB-dependent receptor [Gemmatimonadales bacterium]